MHCNVRTVCAQMGLDIEDMEEQLFSSISCRWVLTSRTWRSRSLTQVLAMAALAGSLPAFLTPWPLLDWLGPQNLSPFFAKLTPNLVPATDMASDMSTESLTKGWKMELRFWVLEFY